MAEAALESGVLRYPQTPEEIEDRYKLWQAEVGAAKGQIDQRLQTEINFLSLVRRAFDAGIKHEEIDGLSYDELLKVVEAAGYLAACKNSMDSQSDRVLELIGRLMRDALEGKE